MKTIILKTVFPVLAFVFAITGALAFKPVTNSGLLTHSGAKKVGDKCIKTNVQCTDVENSMICRDASLNPLFRYIGPTNCPDQLWKVTP